MQQSRLHYNKCMRDDVPAGALHKLFGREQYGASCYAQAGAALFERMTFPMGRECLALIYKLSELNYKDDLRGLLEQLKKEETILDFSETNKFIHWMASQGQFVTRESCDIKEIEKLNSDLKKMIAAPAIDPAKLRSRVESVTRKFNWKKREVIFPTSTPSLRRLHAWSPSPKVFFDRDDCHRRIQTVKHYVCLGIPAAVNFRMSKNYQLVSNKQGGSLTSHASDVMHTALAFASTGKTGVNKSPYLLMDDTIQIENQEAWKALPPKTRMGLLPLKDGCQITSVSVVLTDFERKRVDYIEAHEKKPSKLIEEESLDWKDAPSKAHKSH